MNPAGTLFEHAMNAGYPNVAQYALELEDILEHISIGDRNYNRDPDDIRAAINRAHEIVDGWETS